MSKLITFPNVLYDTQNWLFNMYGVTAEKNSDNTTGNSHPASNKFQVEKGRNYIATTGVPVVRSESGCLEMKYAQSISSHYYMTAYCGWQLIIALMLATLTTHLFMMAFVTLLVLTIKNMTMLSTLVELTTVIGW